jgi:hypothetical protein
MSFTYHGAGYSLKPNCGVGSLIGGDLTDDLVIVGDYGKCVSSLNEKFKSRKDVRYGYVFGGIWDYGGGFFCKKVYRYKNPYFKERK